MFIMGNMALLWGGYGIFSDLLIVFRFPGLQAQYLGQNMPIVGERDRNLLWSGSMQSNVFG